MTKVEANIGSLRADSDSTAAFTESADDARVSFSVTAECVVLSVRSPSKLLSQPRFVATFLFTFI